MKASAEKFSIIKQGIGFHSDMLRQVPDFTFGEVREGRLHANRGLLTERGLNHVIACVEAMKSVRKRKVPSSERWRVDHAS